MRVFTDFRYVEKARLLGLDVTPVGRNLFAELVPHLPARVEFEAEHLSYAAWAVLEGGGIELVRGSSSSRACARSRSRASSMRFAVLLRSRPRCFSRLAEQQFVGREECDLAWWIETTMHELGADGAAFPVIVAAGANGAAPHATTGRQVIEPGQSVVVDAAARLDGYNSDCTRTFATGGLPAELARSYGSVSARRKRG